MQLQVKKLNGSLSKGITATKGDSRNESKDQLGSYWSWDVDEALDKDDTDWRSFRMQTPQALTNDNDGGDMRMDLRFLP